MADRGGTGVRGWRGRGRGRGEFQQSSFPNRGRGDGTWRGQANDRGAWRGNRGGSSGDRGSQRGDRGGRGSTRGRGGFRGHDIPPPFSQNGRVHQPSQIVQTLEDQTFDQSLATGLQNLSIRNLSTAPPRPGYGTKGRAITLWANYFELLPEKTQPFNRYSIMFVAEKDGDEPKGKKLGRLTQLLLSQLPKNVPMASDFRSTIITASSLGFSEQQYLIDYYSEDDAGPTDKPPKYRANIKFTGTLTFESLLEYLSSTNINTDKPAVQDEIVQATNIVLAHGMKTNVDIIAKRNKYFPDGGNLVETWLLTSGLEAFRGFFMSVRAATGRILLNVQIQHIVAWQPLSLPDLIAKFDVERVDFAERNRMIAGVWVHVKHLNNRKKRIIGFATMADGRGTPHPPKVTGVGADANHVKFHRSDPAPARYVSVADHFRETHFALQQPHLPVVNLGTKKAPMYFPAEVCIIVKHQDYAKKLSPNATAAMISKAVRPAPRNAQTIISNGLGILKQNSETLLGNFGVKIDTSMITVNARVLSGVTPTYKGKAQTLNDKASWNMIKVEFSKGAKLGKWTFLWVRTPFQEGRFRSMEEVTQCVTEFYDMLRKCGVDAPQPERGRELRLNNPRDPGAEIDSKFAELKQFSLVLVILPNTNSAIYNAIKIAGDIKYGVHTVDVVGDNKKFAKALDQNNLQYFANVALKFNLKFGGDNQLLRNADLGFVSEGKTMLVGLDVTHPSPGSSREAPSVSSIVASIDARLGQWPADVAIQTARQEIVEGLKDMFKSRLRLWQNRNKQLPEEIIVYRDGVGETMYDLVRDSELPRIKEACRAVYPPAHTKANKPYITIVICGKRHHTRFYPTSEAEADPQTGGTRPGTVVDRSITQTRIWDFYLQAHAALHGTPKPAHYVVVHDEIFRRRAAARPTGGRTIGQQAQDDLEGLTHAMCYMFGRATKAVSLCPPAYYADLVCDRARRWLSRVFDDRTVVTSSSGEAGGATADDVRIHRNLQNSMFYI